MKLFIFVADENSLELVQLLKMPCNNDLGGNISMNCISIPNIVDYQCMSLFIIWLACVAKIFFAIIDCCKALRMTCGFQHRCHNVLLVVQFDAICVHSNCFRERAEVNSLFVLHILHFFPVNMKDKIHY